MIFHTIDGSTARVYASHAHGKQTYGGGPFMRHLDAVAEVLYSFFYEPDNNLIQAAYLHDTIEDTELGYCDIFAAFGPEVAELVWACTGEGEGRAAQQASIRLKIRGCWEATVLKLADRIANVEFCAESGSRKHVQNYLAEAEAFEAAVRVSTPSAAIENMLARLGKAYEKCRQKQSLGSVAETPETSASVTDQSEAVRPVIGSSVARRLAGRAAQARKSAKAA